MFRARVLSLLCAVALALGFGVVATAAPATAATPLSDGCALMHSRASQTFATSGDVVFDLAPYAEGEQVLFVGTTEALGVGLDIVVGLPDGQGIHRFASPGQPVWIPIGASGELGFKLSYGTDEGEDALISWHVDCGLPPTPVIETPADDQTFTVGQNVPTSFSCAEETYPVSSCADTDGDDAGTGTLDTSTAGTHTYTVTGTDSIGFTRTTSITYTVVAQKQPQTVSFTSTAPSHAVVFEGPYFAGAEATSGLPVTFSADAASAGVCSVYPGPGGGAAVTFDGAGTCTINADQAGDDSYLPATRVTQSFTIHKTPTSLVAQKACKCLGITPTTFKATLSWSHPMGPGTITEGLPGQTVSFVVKGKTVCSATTDNTGLATCKATLGLGVALTASSYTASYAGTARFEAATATGKLE